MGITKMGHQALLMHEIERLQSMQSSQFEDEKYLEEEDETNTININCNNGYHEQQRVYNKPLPPMMIYNKPLPPMYNKPLPPKPLSPKIEYNTWSSHEQQK